VQRESALASLNQQLAEPDTLDDAVRAITGELRRLWQASRSGRHLAVDSAESGAPQVMCVGEPASGADLPLRTKQMISRW
jgi:hypothetical protein